MEESVAKRLVGRQWGHQRHSKELAVTFGQAIRSSPLVRIEDLSQEVRERGWELFTTQLDKDYDLMDCLSFALMEAFDVRAAFGFDRHFEQRGLRLRPTGLSG